MDKLVSKIYGDALFEKCKELDKIDILYNEILNLKKILSLNINFNILMNCSKISQEQKKKFVEKIFSTNLSKEIIGFLLIIIKNNRFNKIYNILDYIIFLIKQYKNIGIVNIVSAYELNSDDKKKIEKKILEITKYNSLECIYHVDKNIIAGLKIYIGNKVIDNTIKTKISEISKNLYNIKLLKKG